MTLKKLRKKFAVMVWLQIGNGKNHPMVCAPSEWLLEELSLDWEGDKDLDHDGVVCKGLKTLYNSQLYFPGQYPERWLGSPYHPSIGDLLDVRYHYGSRTQLALDKVIDAACQAAKRDGSRHINYCADFLGKLACSVRNYESPKWENINLEFLES